MSAKYKAVARGFLCAVSLADDNVGALAQLLSEMCDASRANGYKTAVDDCSDAVHDAIHDAIVGVEECSRVKAAVEHAIRSLPVEAK